MKTQDDTLLKIIEILKYDNELLSQQLKMNKIKTGDPIKYHSYLFKKGIIQYTSLIINVMDEKISIKSVMN
jgi:hypothetical protein